MALEPILDQVPDAREAAGDNSWKFSSLLNLLYEMTPELIVENTRLHQHKIRELFNVSRKDSHKSALASWLIVN